MFVGDCASQKGTKAEDRLHGILKNKDSDPGKIRFDFRRTRVSCKPLT